ncbi:MAG TPA: glutathione S-transferase [Kofleriaceae bacterium]|nr:glutathione S-transferase [Kofleriaceae bacterium]
MTATLITLAHSGWSEKARWALDHHRIEYVEKLHTPLLGEPALRWRLRNASGPRSVPVLITDHETIGDSFEIAQHAERHGAGAPLFRRGEEAETRRWNELSDRAMRGGRILILRRTAADPDAKREALPAMIPRALRGALAPAAGLGVRHIQRKYDVPDDEDAARDSLRAVFDELRRALADGRRTIGGGPLGYADIAMAAALQFVRPMPTGVAEMGPATRRVWTDLELAGEYTDLLEWRDQLYATDR